jgi:hypothetical protein
VSEIAVVFPGESTQQCDALEAKQVRQRVLVDHELTAEAAPS